MVDGRRRILTCPIASLDIRTVLEVLLFIVNAYDKGARDEDLEISIVRRKESS